MNRKIHILVAIAINIVVVGLLVSWAITTWFATIDQNQALIEEVESEVVEFMLPAANALHFLSTKDAIKNGLVAPNGIDMLDRRMKQFGDAISNIYQVRFLNLNGQELIKYRRSINPEVTHLVKGELQNKEQQYYFKEAIKLKPNELYLSRIDLNVEHGKIEIPEQIVLRYASVAYDDKDSALGVFIINMGLNKLFQNLEKELENVVGTYQWVNSKGYNILHSQQESFVWQKIEGAKPDVEKAELEKFQSKIELCQVLDAESPYSLPHNHDCCYYIRAQLSPWAFVSTNGISFLGWLILIGVSNTVMWQYLKRIRAAEEKQSETSQLFDAQKVRYDAILDNTYTFIGLIDKDGKLIEANKAALDFGGFIKDQAVGNLFADAPWWQYSTEVNTRLREAIKQAAKGVFIRYDVKVLGVNEQVITIDFSIRPIKNADGSIEFLIVEGRNISELVETRMRLDLAMKGTSAGIWDWMDVNANAEWWSDQFYKLLDYEPGEIEASLENFSALLHKDDKDKTFKAVEDHFKHQQPFNVEYRLKTKSGKYKWFLGTGIAHRDRNGVPTRMIGSIIDIDQRKSLEIEQKELINSLSGKNTQLSEFGHIVSHNIRSPLANLSILIDMYSKQETEAGKDNILLKMSDVNESLQELLVELIDTVKIIDNVGVEAESLKISDSINRAMRMLKSQIESTDAEFRVELEWDDIQYVKVYLDSIMLNFLSNALKYRMPDIQPIINVTSYYDGKMKMLSIKDNGLGIDLDKHERNLFGLHKRFHRNIKGKGLGLFMTKNQIVAMDGSIDVKSKVGEGTEFIIKLANT